MREDDLATIERRWRKRSLFRSQKPRRLPAVGWFLAVVTLAAASALVVASDLSSLGVPGIFGQ
jgi:hypothetical protein